MFGHTHPNQFIIKYEGDSFNGDTLDLDDIAKQLTSLNNLIDIILKEHFENIKADVKKEIQFKKGSFEEIINFVSENPEVTEYVLRLIVNNLAAYLTKKNETSNQLKDEENMINLIKKSGDSISIIGSDKKAEFYLSFENKEKYLQNLLPFAEENSIKQKVETLTGRFRSINLNRNKNELGFDIEGEKGIPTTLKCEKDLVSILSKIIDVDMEIIANVSYKNEKISSIEVLEYKPVNDKLNFTNTKTSQ